MIFQKPALFPSIRQRST